MKEVNFKESDVVIQQGDEGNDLYVVEEGTLDCFKEIEGQDDKLLVSYKPGDAFGELALLYNAPRAATIKASSDTKLFSLDRETFNNIVKEAMIKKREQFKEFFSKIELLDSLNTFEKDKIIDCLKIEKFASNEYVIR